MSSPPRPARYDAFVITAPGLESLAAGELRTLGIANVVVTNGGVTCSATRRALYEANLHLRTATRVVVRAAEFAAKTFHELERRAGRVPWEGFVSPNLAVSLSVTCRKSRLYHSDAVAERVADAILTRVPGAYLASQGQIPGSDLGAKSNDLTLESDPSPIAPNQQLILVRMLHDRCTVSVDSSGALLHMRGYRQAVAKAPIRETLAAAALIASGWRGHAPLIDPMCGSGTIPIEAALIARRIPPGLRRRFAFESWPDFDAGEWAGVVSTAAAGVLSRSPVRILGSDRDAGAVERASANAGRAGVADDIELTRAALSAIDPPDGPGWIVSNPPYGVRVGEVDRLRDLYAQLGNVLRGKCAGWHFAVVSADPGLERQLRLPLEPVLRTTNGGINVKVSVAQVPASNRGPTVPEDAPDAAPAQRYPS
jgi:putative N6-adenine-specific DNA methylase